MACPYFYPAARFETSSWIVPPRLPLGDPYSGECRAHGAAYHPDESTIREVCNVGYGRGRCDRLPENAAADAIRFNVSADEGELIHIQYIVEKECWPKEHGSFECSSKSMQLAGAPADEILQRQASAFLESYVRRRGQ